MVKLQVIDGNVKVSVMRGCQEILYIELKISKVLFELSFEGWIG